MHLERARTLIVLVLMSSLCAQSGNAARLDGAKLEADGVVIGEIRIYAGDVFDLERPDENRFVYRLANRMHVETREGTVERLLLFQVGDPYTEQAIEAGFGSRIQVDGFLLNNQLTDFSLSLIHI